MPAAATDIHRGLCELAACKFNTSDEDNANDDDEDERDKKDTHRKKRKSKTSKSIEK